MSDHERGRNMPGCTACWHRHEGYGHEGEHGPCTCECHARESDHKQSAPPHSKHMFEPGEYIVIERGEYEKVKHKWNGFDPLGQQDLFTDLERVMSTVSIARHLLRLQQRGPYTHTHIEEGK